MKLIENETNYEYIIVETDEDNPTTIATISDNDIECAEGYRVRLKPI